jgi:small subunit ribosomal protein S12
MRKQEGRIIKMTINQLARLKNRRERKEKGKVQYEERKPQIKGIVIKVFTMTPKKPNSALRKVVKIKTTLGELIAYVPGENHTINIHNIILVRSGKTQDLPGVNYKVIRGKYDALAPIRSTSRSKYGVKKHSHSTHTTKSTNTKA